MAAPGQARLSRLADRAEAGASERRVLSPHGAAAGERGRRTFREVIGFGRGTRFDSSTRGASETGTEVTLLVRPRMTRRGRDVSPRQRKSCPPPKRQGLAGRRLGCGGRFPFGHVALLNLRTSVSRFRRASRRTFVQM